MRNENKTKRFLVPCLARHGLEFIIKMNNISHLIKWWGIHDKLLKDEYIDRKKICILFETVLCFDVLSLLEWVREKDYYITDYYIYHRAMLVIEIPVQYHDIYDIFLTGNYPAMYKEKDIISLKFAKNDRYILKNDTFAKDNFIKILRQEFQITLSHSDIKPPYELPLKVREEVYHVVKTENIFLTKENYLCSKF
jgi:hypothetical protein